ncbi:MAG: tRNA (adenosine(37)-N6)-threonylcarbamoyltransferase complex dimerization subunit type 1 TsaB [Coprococcus sp.]
MKILALESSGLVASVAVVTEDRLIGEYTTNFKKTHSQTLLPMMDTLLKMTGISVTEVNAIAVSGGPGSFTGLRIGSATAKGLGLALNKPIISVPTVDAIAYNLFGTDALVCPLMDARRNQTYTGLYTFEGDQMICLVHQKAVMIDEIISEINDLGRRVIFLGDGVPVFRQALEEGIQVPHTYAPIHLNQQRAGALGALAVQYYKEGRCETPAEHQPDYLRLSQAERELAAKKKEEPSGK